MRLLHTMLRVGDLQRSVKFYTEVLGMKLLRTTDRPEQKYSLAFVRYDDEERASVLELTYNHDGRTYDLVVVCTGNREAEVDGLAFEDFYDYAIPDSDAVVASQHYNLPVFRVGPHARLPITPQEYEDGVADIPANAVSMFRTASKTAALAATLPAVTED